MTTLLGKVKERLAELKRIYGGHHREVRLTAVGWQPGEGWTEDPGPTPSGSPEFYRVIREGTTEAQPEPVKEARRVWTAEEILQREG
jgi:hypothetical protein